MSEPEHLVSLRERLFPDLVKLATRSNSLKTLSSAKSSQPRALQFDYSKRRERLPSNPQSALAKPSPSSVSNRLSFLSSSLKYLSSHIESLLPDPTLLHHLHQVKKSLVLLSDELSSQFSQKSHEISSSKQQSHRLSLVIADLTKQNQQLRQSNKKLIMYERGINQVKLSYENDKLRLELEELTRVLGDKERRIAELELRVEELERDNQGLRRWKGNMEARVAKMREEMDLLNTTKEMNLLKKLKYIFD